MACPYFYPVARNTRESGARDAMLPLGDRWAGVCRAGASPQEGAAVSGPMCNLGYAREECSRFPAGSGPDAVRFTLRAAEPSSLNIYFVIERDHHPFAHGALEYSRERRALLNPPGDEILRRQAEAYAESYLRLKGAAV